MSSVSSRSVVLYIFSGTGNTRYVAEALARELERNGLRVAARPVDRDLIAAGAPEPDPRDADLVGLAYPVHAWNAPRLVFELIERLPPVPEGKPAFLLRTAGDPLLNGGATAPVRERLLAKGYGVFRDDLAVMPANMALRYDERLVKHLLLKAERVAERAAEGIAATEVSLPGETWALRLASRLSSGGETRGARWFGRHTRVAAACTGCERCALECPTDNIRLDGGRPHFGDDCTLCLHCFYVCPEGALTPVVGRWLLIDDWYDLAEIARDDGIPADPEDARAAATRPGFFRRFWRYVQSP